MTPKTIMLTLVLLVALIAKSQVNLQTSNMGNPKNLDTIKVVMLYSDTTFLGGNVSFTAVYHQNNGREIKIGEMKNHAPYALWMYGYSVREQYCCINGNDSNTAMYNPKPYYIHLNYLDSKRQPLSKNIIVWQSLSTN